MNVRFVLAAAALAACLPAVSGCARSQQRAAPPPPVVHVSTAVPGSIHPTTTLSGLIAPLQNVVITNDLQEPAAAVYVNEGDRITRGQVLARLSTSDLDANLAAAQRNAAVAQAHLEQTRYQATYAIQSGSDQVRSAQAAAQQAQANLQLAQSNLNRDEQLAAQGFIAAQQVDQQRNQVQVSQQQLASARAALVQAQQNAQANGTSDRGMQQANVQQAAASLAAANAQADAIAAQIAKAAILSPIDGVVVNRNLNPGEYPGTRQIFTLQAVSTVYAELNAYGSQVSGISTGTAVSLTSPSVPHKSFRGTVVALLSPTSPSSTGFIVKVRAPNPTGELKPGLTVSGVVAQPPVSGIVVPVTAFTDDTHTTVLAVNDDTAHAIRVTEVAEDGNNAIVTGVPRGTQIVRNGSSNVADGQKVAIR